jgi:hypothetical protein
MRVIQGPFNHGVITHQCTNIADVSVCIQPDRESVPSTPSWFGEVALIPP